MHGQTSRTKHYWTLPWTCNSLMPVNCDKANPLLSSAIFCNAALKRWLIGVSQPDDVGALIKNKYKNLLQFLSALFSVKSYGKCYNLSILHDWYHFPS